MAIQIMTEIGGIVAIQLDHNRDGYTTPNYSNTYSAFTEHEKSSVIYNSINLQNIARQAHYEAVQAQTVVSKEYDLVKYPSPYYPDQYGFYKIVLGVNAYPNEPNATLTLYKARSVDGSSYELFDHSTGLVVQVGTTPTPATLFDLILIQVERENVTDGYSYTFCTNLFHAQYHGSTIPGYEFLSFDETLTGPEFVEEGYSDLTICLNSILNSSFSMSFNSTDAGLVAHDSNNSYYNPDEPPAPGDRTPYNDPSEPSTDTDSTAYNQSSDTVANPEVTNNDAVSSGMISIYHIAASHIPDLVTFMLDPDLETKVAKLFKTDPMEYVIALNMMPINLTGSSANVKIGGFQTSIPANKISKQIITFDCGSITLKGTYTNFLDYLPYTKIKIFLPFIGYQDLDTADCMGATIGVKYYLDLVNCVCMAVVHCQKSFRKSAGPNQNLNGVTYCFTGSFGLPVPLCASDYRARATALIGAVGGVVGGAGLAAMTGGSAMPLLGAAAAGAVNVATAKPSVQRNGGFSGNASVMGPKTPYLLVTLPINNNPKHFGTVNGYASNVGGKISEFERNGLSYTEFSDVHLYGIPCTDEEMEEIVSLLKEGVYL